jgi:hypothetical protein
MANLILKPSTGGVLKIQNDAGTVDALTISTGGNLTAAGTLGVTGNTTLSGTANNLGTVTAGTLSHGTTLQKWVDSSNTGVTFPEGCIVQAKTYKNNTRWEGYGLTNLSMTITPKFSTTIMIIQTYIMGETGTNRHDMCLRLHSSVGGYISDGSVGISGMSAKLHEGGYTGDDYNSTPGNLFHQAHEDHNTTSTITYKWYVSNGTNNLTLQGCTGSGNESAPSWMTVWEVMT